VRRTRAVSRSARQKTLTAQDLLYDEHRIEIPVFDSAVGRVIRASFQGYNDESDLEALATALEATRVTARPRGS
jgi:selenocysteine lyase/cysteine desulfurase